MFNRHFAFIPLTFALLLMSYSEPQKQTDAIEFECAGVAQEQIAAIASEIAANHEPAIVTEYLKWYCLGYQGMQEYQTTQGTEDERIGVGVFLWSDDDRVPSLYSDERLASLYSTAYRRGILDAQRSVNEPDQ